MDCVIGPVLDLDVHNAPVDEIEVIAYSMDAVAAPLRSHAVMAEGITGGDSPAAPSTRSARSRTAAPAGALRDPRGLISFTSSSGASGAEADPCRRGALPGAMAVFPRGASKRMGTGPFGLGARHGCAVLSWGWSVARDLLCARRFLLEEHHDYLDQERNEPDDPGRRRRGRWHLWYRRGSGVF